MRTCRAVLLPGTGDLEILAGELSRADPEEAVLAIAVTEAAEVVERYRDACIFLHLLPGCFLFGRTQAVLSALAKHDLDPGARDDIAAAVLYGNLRYYDPVKSWLARERFERVTHAAERNAISPLHTVLAAARALGLTVEERAR